MKAACYTDSCYTDRTAFYIYQSIGPSRSKFIILDIVKNGNFSIVQNNERETILQWVNKFAPKHAIAKQANDSVNG